MLLLLLLVCVVDEICRQFARRLTVDRIGIVELVDNLVRFRSPLLFHSHSTELFARMIRVRHLFRRLLDNNLLTSTIPSQIGQLVALTELFVKTNRFSIWFTVDRMATSQFLSGAQQ